MGQDSQPVWGSSVTTRVVVRRKLRAAAAHLSFAGVGYFPTADWQVSLSSGTHG